MLSIRHLPRSVLVLIALAFAVPLAGCELEEAEAPVVEAAYQPTYYDGYVVYDAGGLPSTSTTPRITCRNRTCPTALSSTTTTFIAPTTTAGTSPAATATGDRPSAPARVITSSSTRVYRPSSPVPHAKAPRHAPRSAPRHGVSGGSRFRGGFHGGVRA